MAQGDRNYENRFGREEPFGREERYGSQSREGREGSYGYGGGFGGPQGGYPQGGYGQGYGRQGRGQEYGQEGWGEGSGQQYGYGPGYGQQGGYGQFGGRSSSGWGESMPGYGYGRGQGEREQYGSMGQQGYERGWGSTGADYASGFGQQRYGSRGRFVGRGPKGYRRTDERIQEEINEQLTRHPEIDASEIEVSVKNGEVTLSGTVDDRHAKRLAEDIAEECSGVSEVRNNIRVQRQGQALGAGRGEQRSAVEGQQSRGSPRR
jgi:osmotically-inducible protein OsmY